MQLHRMIIIAALGVFTLFFPVFSQFAGNAANEEMPHADRSASEDIWKIRPGKNGPPTEVSVGVFVLDVSNITDVDHTFTVDFVLRLRWKDPRLASEPKGLTRSYRKFNLQDIWNPKVNVLNRWGLSELNGNTVEVDSEGTVVYRQRFQGNLTFPIELRDFPFDEHVLLIELASSQFDPEAVLFSTWEERSGQRDTFSIVDWQIGLGNPEVKPIRVEDLSRTFSGFTYQLKAKRYVGFYIWKVIFPLSLIVLMSFSVCWLKPGQLGAQIGLSTASVFALIAFQFAIGNHLPRVSYITRMDYFILGSTILVFSALGEAIITGGLAESGNTKMALKIDRWSRWIFPLLLILIIVLSFGF